MTSKLGSRWLLYLTAAICFFAQDYYFELAPAFASKSASSDGFEAELHDTVANWKRLSAGKKTEAKRTFARPGKGYRTSTVGYRAKEAEPYATPHFLIHYVKSTQDAPIRVDSNFNGIRDFVEEVGVEAERAWQKEVEEQGWPAPTADGNAGGDGRYDIYLVDLTPEGAFGATAPAKLPSSNASFIVVDNDFPTEDVSGVSPGEALRQTITHEFFHAVQLGMNRHLFERDSLLWLIESTAMWMEVQLSTNDVEAEKALEDFYQALIIPVYGDEAGISGLIYGAWPYWTTVQDRYGVAAVRAIFNLLAAQGSRVGTGKDRYGLLSIKRVLKTHDYSLYALFTDFALNAYRSSGEHFGASSEPELNERLIKVNRPRRFTTTTEEFIGDRVVSKPTERLLGLATSFYTLRLDSPGTVDFRFTWRGPRPRMFIAVGGRSGSVREVAAKGKRTNSNQKTAVATVTVPADALQRVGVVISSGSSSPARISGRVRLRRLK